jgi:hypothetical protein
MRLVQRYERLGYWALEPSAGQHPHPSIRSAGPLFAWGLPRIELWASALAQTLFCILNIVTA